jgi:hypothetical protein
MSPIVLNDPDAGPVNELLVECRAMVEPESKPDAASTLRARALCELPRSCVEAA